MRMAVIPAAGQSRRMGQPKLLLPWGAGTVFEQVLDTWLASRVTHVLVVVRADDEPVRRLCEQRQVLTALAVESPPEMKDSVVLGLRQLRATLQPHQDSAWLLAPADTPQLTAQAINAVVEAFDPSQPQIIVPCCEGRRGHPVLFPWQLATEVEVLGPQASVRDVMQRHPVRKLELPDPGILGDLDTPEDYRRLAPPPR